MKLSKCVLPIVGLCTLTSCESKVSKEEFLKSTEKIETHLYKKASVRYIEEENNERVEMECTFVMKDGVFEPEKDYKYVSRVSRLYYLIDNLNSKEHTYYDFEDIFDNYEKQAKREDSKAKVKSNVKYYVKPFKIEGELSVSFNGDKNSVKREIDFTYKYDKYGYLTFMEETYNYEITEKSDGYKSTSKEKSYNKVKISYKD